MPLPGQLQVSGSLTWPSLYVAILFGSLALISFVLWRRFRSRRLLMQRVAELEQLSAAGRAIVAAELDVVALCELIAEEAGKVIDNQTFQVGLFEGEAYHILYWRIDGRPQPTPQTFDLSEHPGIVGWVRQTRQTLLVRDFQRQAQTLPATPRYISQTPPRSAIFIPLISGEKVMGIVAAQSQRPNRFDEEDRRLLMILANQAGAAIANAQLYAQAQMRAAHLELVHKIARQVNAVTDPEAIFDQVVRLTHELFGFQPVNIFSLDPVSGEAVIKASNLPGLCQTHPRIPPPQGIIGTAVATRQTILSNDTHQDDLFIPARRLANLSNEEFPDVHAEIAIPLLVDNEVLGVLDVNSARRGAFGPAEQTVLEALAAEVASAIHKAQQLAREQERAWLTTAQLQLAAALSHSESLEDIATAVTRLTPLLAGFALCGLLLWEEETAVYQRTALYLSPKSSPSRAGKTTCALGDWPALDAVHVGQYPLTTRQIPPWLQLHTGYRLLEVTLLPLKTKAQPWGILLVGDLTPPPTPSPLWRQRRQELLENITDQTSRAIENAMLRQAQQEEAWVNTALLQVAEAVNSRIDLNDILTTIVRLVPVLVGVESVAILTWDKTRRVFRPTASYGISHMGRGLIETLEIEPEEFPGLMQLVTEDLLSSHAVAMSATVPTNPTLSATHYVLPPSPWMRKVLGTPQAYLIPLHARGQLVGGMLVGSGGGNGRSLSRRRLNILNGIAHQAATAVVNNHLYQEAAERDRLAQEISVAHRIQASLIPPGNPQIPGCSVSSFWQAARQVSGDFYDFIPLRNGDWGIVVADVADKGVPAALFMALSRTILRTVAFNRQNPAEVLMRVNDIIDAEAQSDLFVTVFYAVWHPKSETITYANGGHNPPLLLRQDGQSRLLTGEGMALGVLPGIAIEAKTIHLHPNDTLILYTDGVTEAMNEDFDEFGLERLRLAALAARQQDARGIMQAITDSVSEHAGDTPQSDDITLVVMKRYPHVENARRNP